MAATKITTGLTGLAVDPFAPQKLLRVYRSILKTLSAMPQTASYRRHTEQIVNQRMKIVETEKDPLEIEKKINMGQIEEIVLQAEREFHLAQNMLEWKPWEPLLGEAPKNQWKWPV